MATQKIKADAEASIRSSILHGISSVWDKKENVEILRDSIFDAIFDKSVRWSILEYLQSQKDDESCFACGHKIVERKESLSKGLCNTLIKFFKASNFIKDGVFLKPLHIRKHTVNGVRYFETVETNNFQKLQYWGLVRPAQTKGFWYLTDAGVKFILGEKSVPKYLFVQNNRVTNESSEKVKISQVTEIPYWLEKEHYQK